MNVSPLSASPAQRRLLDEAQLSGPMPWVIAIMMFLAILSVAAGLALNNAVGTMKTTVGQRVTVQVIEANPDLREQQAAEVIAQLQAIEGASNIVRVPDEEIDSLLEPYIGASSSEEGIPAPALIDADLSEEAHSRLPAIEAAIEEAVPTARVDDHAAFMAPLTGLFGSLGWLATALLLLALVALVAIVIIAVRASLAAHRDTIDVMHLLGATDVQIARLFQRRIAVDALFGGIIGLVAAIAVILLLGRRVGAIGSELLGTVNLPLYAWFIIILLPIAGATLAMLVARISVLSALKKML